MKTPLRLLAALLLLFCCLNQAFARTAETTSVSSNLPAKGDIGLNAVTPFKLFITKAANEPSTATNVNGVFRLTGDNIAIKANNIDLDYTLDGGSTWQDVQFNTTTGEANLGSYPFADSEVDFRVKFTAVGSYSYTLELTDAAGAVLASKNETVNVVFNEPTINSTLDNISRNNVIATGAEVLFEVFLKAKDRAGETVTTRLVLDNPADRTKFTLQYATNEAETEFETLAIGEDGVAVFGPETGFTLADMEQLFKIRFAEAGTYSYSIQVLKGNDVLGFSDETITVVAGNAAIASSLNGNTYSKEKVQPFTLTLNTGAWSADTKYRVRLQLQDPAYANNFTLTFEDGSPVFTSFDENGVAYYGTTAGFDLMQGSTTVNLKLNVPAYGTYNYKLELLRVVEDQDPQVIARANESVTIAFINASVATTLASRAGVKTGVPQVFTVTANPGDVDATMMVLGRLTLANADQAEDFMLEYLASVNNYEEVAIGNDGVVTIGPAGGVMLSEIDALGFRATFDAVGTYAYKLELVKVADNEVIATANESVTVTEFVNATVASTLNNRTGVKTTVPQEFTVTATAGDVAAATMVRGRLILASDAQAESITLEYKDSEGDYQPIAIGANGMAIIGPAAGMMLSEIKDLGFRVTFDEAGEYVYTFRLETVATVPTTIASSDESVSVTEFVNATLATTLDGEEIERGLAKTFTVQATAGDVAATTLVRGRLTLTDAAQAANVTLKYRDAANNFQPIAFANCIAEIGPAEGMALSMINGLEFEVTLNATGVYNYTLELYTVDGNKVIATATESVEAIAPTSIKKGFEQGGFAVYPTLTTGAVKVDLVNARNASIQVIDMMGRAVVSKNNANGIVALDLSNVAKGTYVIKIQDGGNVNTQRIVVR